MSSSSSTSSPSQRKWLLAGAIGAAVVAGGAAFALVRSRRTAAATRLANLPTHTPYMQVRVAAEHTYADYQNAIKTVAQETEIDRPFYVYVGAANDAVTGRPWCGDCRDSNPVVDRAFSLAFESRPELLMVSVFVDRASYKDAVNTHPLRTDPELKLTAVPTLFKFVNNKCVARLVEADCAQEQLVAAFIAEAAELP